MADQFMQTIEDDPYNLDIREKTKTRIIEKFYSNKEYIRSKNQVSLSRILNHIRYNSVR